MDEHKYTILYIDDEEVNLLLFRSTFRRDFNVITANSAKQGLNIIEKQHIDAIVTDQRMPEMTGVELLKVINGKFPEIPPSRLIVSGFASNEDIEEAFNHYNLFRFVPKPWNAENLKKTIIDSIEGSHGK
ncbi:hypothetical protein CYCD_11080 [Tenuifilaceae bacterium CYCD]|nr:hypothetical protein CYCD_11080 [Tenuifilaceae bacterium CYCD]